MSKQQPEIKPVKIGNRFVGPGHPVYIVAELSANHRQDFNEAVRLIHAAKDAGADAVKLQTYTPDTMTIDCDDDNFRHGHGSLWEGKTLYELYKEACMPWEWQPRLQAVAHDIGLDLFSSAYEETSVDFLDGMDVPAIKISSFEIIDLPLIQYAAATNRPLIISTGMATLAEISDAVDASRQAGCREMVLLKCTSTYPAPMEEMNLSTIPAMARTFNLPCGLSDHAEDELAALVAVAMGACLLEKHFTLSRANNSVDSGFSIEPPEFKAMVASVRRVERMMGKEFPGPTLSETESISFRRSLYASTDINRGEIIARNQVRSIRPHGGLKPECLEKIVGMKAKKKIHRGQPITWEAIETD
ncbi:pseudaminic acid synthase [Desulfosarcina sp.]|uniref:pseudaminic acid synthase n=1 Tax=Desulfosarcina sp. TaxID=2027861 RepID=UPI003564DDFC